MTRIKSSCVLSLCQILVLLPCSLASAQDNSSLRGKIIDAATGRPVAARLYIRAEDGAWFFARSADGRGSAVRYQKQRSPSSVEQHTTLSAHPFRASLPPGKYMLVAERGQEYFPETATIEIREDPVSITLALRRWVDMSQDGWYSGETHVHRPLEELPNLMLAEDLNVSLPLTYWVTRSDTPPAQGDKNSPPVAAELIEIDATHVIYPLNTEYEIFTVADKRHTLGAVFALNQKTVLDRGVPPVKPIAQQVHREGGLLELDKHNWPWSMMLVPVMDVDLYELTNNHLWRTEFFFGKFGIQPPAYMRIEQNENGMTERGWIDYTLQNYYALLNCGFRLRPTAGTASGVHPVPLGFGRVYVQLPDGFSYDAWMRGLDAGRSFVTTGPMLAAQLNERFPGATIRAGDTGTASLHLTGWIRSARPLSSIEVVAAGRVIRTITPTNQTTAAEAYQTTLDESFMVDRSSWIVVRCYEPRAPGRWRFAHTAPWHVSVPGKPLRPRRVEVEFLVERVRGELQRNAAVLSPAALQEYRDALIAYERLLEQAE